MRAPGWLLVVVLVAAVAGCTNKDHATGTAPAPSTTVDTTLAAQVPYPIRSAGAIIVATDPRYEPAEFRSGDKAVGFDVDLFNAVAGKLGLRTQWKAVDFDQIIAGVTAGTYHVGVSSFTVRADREEQVTMVSYYTAGTQWAAKAGAAVDPDSACGAKVAVQAGTTQVADLATRSGACTAAGKPAIQADTYPTQAEVTAAVVDGKDDALLADSPVTGYAVQRSKGALALVGRLDKPVRYGYALPRDEPDFAAAVVRALRQLMAEGTYRSILDKWGVGAGAISDPAANPTVPASPTATPSG
jgi:polar amino acid transport system substrate-binding protein